MADGSKYAVLKWINYKTADITYLKKGLNYISNSKSSPIKYQKGYWITKEEPLQGMAVVNSRWNPRGIRAYKHGVFSFGNPEVTVDKVFAVSDEILQYYANRYPILLCVHTNIPRRIHSHFIMSTVDIRTGKKFDQSPQEFENFRNYFNDVTLKNGLRPLKGVTLDDVLTEAKIVDPLCKNEPLIITPSNLSVLQPVGCSDAPVYRQHSPYIKTKRDSSFYIEFDLDMMKVVNEITVGYNNLFRKGQ